MTRAEREPTEFFGGKSCSAKNAIRTSAAQVEVGCVRQVTVEVHGAPTREELLGVAQRYRYFDSFRAGARLSQFSTSRSC